jgi:branched-chain amino acid transport system ATP-binding protein
MTDLLAVTGLEVAYHRVATAIQGVSFQVPPGRIVALLGPNGSGKTTTLRALSGFLPAEDAHVTDGAVTFLGHDVRGLAPHHLARRGLVLVPEREKVFESLTVAENLAASTRPPRPGRPEVTREQVEAYFPVLGARRRQLAGYLSGGERQMLALASALLCQPALLLVDELSLGLAPRVVGDLVAIVARLRDELGLAVLLVEQNAAAALEIADHGYVLEHGRIVYDGSAAQLRDNEDIREFYLGLSTERATKSYREVKQYRRRRRWFG